MAQAFLSGWIVHFRILSSTTTDSGTFWIQPLVGVHESSWVDLYKNDYLWYHHSCSNSMVKHFHRQLKAALKCHNNKWDSLPLVMLNKWASLKLDIGCGTAELVEHMALHFRLQGGFFLPSSSAPSPVSTVTTSNLSSLTWTNFNLLHLLPLQMLPVKFL